MRAEFVRMASKQEATRPPVVISESAASQFHVSGRSRNHVTNRSHQAVCAPVNQKTCNVTKMASITGNAARPLPLNRTRHLERFLRVCALWEALRQPFAPCGRVAAPPPALARHSNHPWRRSLLFDERAEALECLVPLRRHRLEVRLRFHHPLRPEGEAALPPYSLSA